MKNFQVKHGQCDRIIFPTTFSFESSKWLLDLCFADSRILYFWQVLESIHKFIIELHVLQYLFVRGSNKKRWRGRIISNFRKGETFHLFGQPSALGGNLTMWRPFFHPPKRSSVLTLAKKRTYLDTQLKRDLYWFALKIA